MAVLDKGGCFIRKKRKRARFPDWRRSRVLRRAGRLGSEEAGKLGDGRNEGCAKQGAKTGSDLAKRNLRASRVRVERKEKRGKRKIKMRETRNAERAREES